MARTPAGWRASTAAGDFDGALLVNAAGAWADQVALLAGIRPLGLTPLRRSMARIPAPGGHDLTKWPMIFGAGETWYAKPDAGALLVSPRSPASCLHGRSRHSAKAVPLVHARSGALGGWRPRGVAPCEIRDTRDSHQKALENCEPEAISFRPPNSSKTKRNVTNSLLQHYTCASRFFIFH
jgi:glycine/D-amino acid oxidase-like deaminating enzyme